jgi:hypothetical protein
MKTDRGTMQSSFWLQSRSINPHFRVDLAQEQTHQMHSTLRGDQTHCVDVSRQQHPCILALRSRIFIISSTFICVWFVALRNNHRQCSNFKHTELCLVVAASIVVLAIWRFLVDCKDAKFHGPASVHFLQ